MVTEDGLYELKIGSGATISTSNATISINSNVVLSCNLGIAYNTDLIILKLKAGTVLTYSNGTATTTFVVIKIAN